MLKQVYSKRKVLKIISVMFYLLALCSPVYPDTRGWGSWFGITVLLVSIPLGWLQASFAQYANLIYLWILVKKKEMFFPAFSMIILSLQALTIYTLEADLNYSRPISAFGIGFYF